jgi:hydrogenase maturation protease
VNALVVGLGDPARGDDGVGFAVARMVAARALPGVSVCVLRDPVALLDLWCGHARVVVVDAVRSGAAPGTTHCIDASPGQPPLPAASWASTGRGTHAFGVAAVVELARALHRLPEELVVIGVEAASFGHGAPLSGPVQQAVPAVVDLVEELVVEQLSEEVRSDVPR